MIALLNAVLLAGTITTTSTGIDAREITMTFALGDVAAEEWRAEDVRISVTLPHRRPGKVQVRLAELVLASEQGRVSKLELSCDSLWVDRSAWRCREGRFSAAASPLGAFRDVSWVGRWDRHAGAHLTLRELPIAGGTLALALVWQAGTWEVESDLRQLRLERLRQLLPAAHDWEAWTLGGRLSGTAEATGAGKDIQSMHGRVQLAHTEFASPDGLQAAEGVALVGRVKVSRNEAAWEMEMRLTSDQGQVYVDPVFVDAGANPLTFEGYGRWVPIKRRWDLERWSLVQANTVKANGVLTLSGPPFRSNAGRVQVQSANVSALYERWLQPFMIGSLGGDLMLRGASEARAHWDKHGLLMVDLGIDNLSAQDQAQRFAVDGVHGAWHWHREAGSVATSRLQVRGARLYRLPIGPFDFAFQTQGSSLELLRPLELPMLEGAVRVVAFQADKQADRLRANASVVVDELGLEALTEALGWPKFRGVLSGSLPNVSYETGVIRTNDDLSFSAFDGTVVLQDLVIRDVFGVLPVLETEAVLRGLDLAALTEAFALGRIEGRLDGELLNLELLGWQPNRFDLHLYTSPDSRARRRISQRAVENLTELGTGVPGGLSATILKIFDDFYYNRIAIRIALRGDTAELGGLDAPNGGYYLVRGAGLPRIDVIGRNRQVEWKELLRRLQDIQLEGIEVK